MLLLKLKLMKLLANLIDKHDRQLYIEAKETHEKRNQKLVKAGKDPLPFRGIISADGFVTRILKSIVLELPLEKPPTRKVFTFKGIQSSCGVSRVKETGLIYNNRFPTAELKSGLVCTFDEFDLGSSYFKVIPKSLAHEEPRPRSQIRTTQHRKRRLNSLADLRKRFKKSERIKHQNEEWEKLEAEGERFGTGISEKRKIQSLIRLYLDRRRYQRKDKVRENLHTRRSLEFLKKVCSKIINLDFFSVSMV